MKEMNRPRNMRRPRPEASTPTVEATGPIRRRALDMENSESEQSFISINNISSSWSANSSEIYERSPTPSVPKRILRDTDIVRNIEASALIKRPRHQEMTPSSISRIADQTTTPANKIPPKKAPSNANANEAPTKTAPANANEASTNTAPANANEAPTKKAPANKTPPNKSPTKKAPPNKSPTKKAPGNKSPTKKAPPNKSPGNKSPTRKAPANKSPTKKAPANKTPTKKAPANKTPAKKAPKPLSESPKKRGRMSLSFADNKRVNASFVDQHVWHLQRSTHHLIPKRPFQRTVREITTNLTGDTYRFTTASLDALQEAAESYLVGLFEDSYLLSLHAKRITLYLSDMKLARRIRGDS